MVGGEQFRHCMFGERVQYLMKWYITGSVVVSVLASFCLKNHSLVVHVW